MMCSFVIVSLILTAIVSRTAATPFSARSDYLETAALGSDGGAALGDQLFDSQQFDNQNGLVAAFQPDDGETDTLFPQNSSDLDGSYFFDELASTINTKNSEDQISSAAMCDAPTDGQSSNSLDLLQARDLSDVFNLRLPDLDQKPSCKNPGYESPQPPTLKPEWVPPPTLDPVNTERCPRESDGIQPIALCCYQDDFGQNGERIAVARACYTYEEVLANGGKCDNSVQRCCKLYHEDWREGVECWAGFFKIYAPPQ